MFLLVVPHDNHCFAIFSIVDAIRNLFDVQFSAEHDPIREKEEAAYVMFVNLLYDCEGIKRCYSGQNVKSYLLLHSW